MLIKILFPLKYYYENQNIMSPGFLFKLLGATWLAIQRGKDESPSSSQTRSTWVWNIYNKGRSRVSALQGDGMYAISRMHSLMTYRQSDSCK